MRCYKVVYKMNSIKIQLAIFGSLDVQGGGFKDIPNEINGLNS